MESFLWTGADDNASGCITLLEALRAVVANGIIPNRTVEFHWYAAEERGLLGSREIARSYKEAGANVTGMINYDVVGYYVEGNDDIAIITDYVDSELTQFLRVLVDGYLTFGRRERGQSKRKGNIIIHFRNLSQHLLWIYRLRICMFRSCCMDRKWVSIS